MSKGEGWLNRLLGRNNKGPAAAENSRKIGYVELRTGTRVPENVCVTVYKNLKSLFESPDEAIALYDLANFARTNRQIKSELSLKILKQKGLITAEGVILDHVKDVILAAVEGDGLQMRLVNPLKVT